MILRWLKLQRPVAHAEKALEYVEKVLDIVQKQASSYPSELEVHSWIISQIEYIKLVLSDPSVDRSELREINFGTADLRGRY